MLQQHTHVSERKFLSAMLRQISHERSYHFVIALWKRKSGRIRPREVLGNNRRQPQQSRLDLGLRLSRRFSRANNLDCRRTSRQREEFRCLVR
jgi:hypothetical protein